MKRHSLTGPLLLLIVGALFLWRNLHPETQIFDLVTLYWPFLLMGWGLLRLVEVLIWSRHGYRTGLSGGEVVLVVMICLGGWGMYHARKSGVHFVANGLDIWGQQYDYQVSARASAAGAKRIVFENPRGNVRVTGGDSESVEITGRKLIRTYARQEADRTSDATPVEIVPDGDRLVVRTNQDNAPGNQRISDDLEVVIPRRLSVEARSGTGDYEIADVLGDVELTLDRGDVRLARVGGNARLQIDRSDLIRASAVQGTIDLQGSGSDIDFENIGGQVTINGGFSGALDFKNLAKPLQFDGARNTQVRVQGVPGRINMDLTQFSAKDITGPVRLVTSSRDVKMEQFTSSLDLETDRGDVELIPGRLPLPAIDARAASGRIDLVLPAKAAFTLQATVDTGDASNDFGPPIQKDVSGRSAVLSGQVGTGGPTIRVIANRGWISVRKEGSLSSLPAKSAESTEL